MEKIWYNSLNNYKKKRFNSPLKDIHVEFDATFGDKAVDLIIVLNWAAEGRK